MNLLPNHASGNGCTRGETPEKFKSVDGKSRV